MRLFIKISNYLFLLAFSFLLFSCYQNEFDAEELQINIITNDSDMLQSNQGAYSNYSDITPEGLANVILDNGKEKDQKIQNEYTIKKNLIFSH